MQKVYVAEAKERALIPVFNFQISKEERILTKEFKRNNREELREHYGYKRCGYLNAPNKQIATIRLGS